MHECPNGKKYIGITGQSPERRWQKGAGYFYGTNSHFEKAIKKYGWDSIEHKIIASGLKKEEAEKMEIDLISTYKTTDRNFGYNIDSGGNSCGKHTEEYKARMSKIQKEVWKRDPDRRKRMSELAKGRKLSEETKQKLREANLGKKHTEESKLKMKTSQSGKKKPKTSESLKKAWAEGKMKGMTGKKTSALQKEKARKQALIQIELCKKPVIAHKKNGEYVGEFESGAEAGRLLGISNSKITEVCKRKRKSCYGYVFDYKKEE